MIRNRKKLSSRLRQLFAVNQEITDQHTSPKGKLTAASLRPDRPANHVEGTETSQSAFYIGINQCGLYKRIVTIT
jgi:hypothetical protein